jgi:preprotein translocase subunit SecG
MLILNVIYVLIAIAMIALILMQRGAGAQAGSGFGSGASATVFGARGASNFMSKATKWLAIVFFGISLYMAWYATHSAKPAVPSQQDTGLMGETAPSATPKPGDKAPQAQVPPQVVPSAPSVVPTAPAQALPVPATPVPANPAPQGAAPAAPATPRPAAPPPASPQGG